MPTKRRRRTRGAVPQYSQAVVFYLESGDHPDSDGEHVLELFTMSEQDFRAAWLELREPILADWTRQHPGTRPWAWWAFDAPEPRQRVGGVGDVFHGGQLQLGIETDWVLPWMVEYFNGRSIAPRLRGGPWMKDFVEGHFEKVAVDLTDPPRYESQASYLRRLDLLTPTEASSLTKSAFEPEAISREHRSC